jgi:hypothetical protein
MITDDALRFYNPVSTAGVVGIAFLTLFWVVVSSTAVFLSRGFVLTTIVSLSVMFALFCAL